MVIGMDSDLLYPLFEQEEVRMKLYVRSDLIYLPPISIFFPCSRTIFVRLAHSTYLFSCLFLTFSQSFRFYSWLLVFLIANIIF